MTQLLPTPIFRAEDNNGAPLAGGALWTYQAGTTTPQVTYTDSTGGTPNPNPVPLNARGEAQVWMTAGQAYKFLLTDSFGTTIPGWPVDNVTAPDAGGSASSLLSRLADPVDPANGPGMMGFNPAVAPTYPSNTVGAWLNVLASRSPAEIAAGVTPTAWQYAEGDIRRYGAPLNGSDSDSAALDKLYLVLKFGGHGFIPARSMLLTTQSTLTIDNAGTAGQRYGNIMIEGYGCEIFTTGAIAALDVRYGFTPMNVALKGMKINHRGNNTAVAGVRLRGCSNVTLEDIAIEGNNTSATYGGFMLLQDDPSDNNTACFWTTLRGCSTRKRSGGDAGAITAAVIMEGSQNATLIEDNNFGGGGLGIAIRVPFGYQFLSNGYVIQNNAFEGLTRAIACTTGTNPANAQWDTGGKILGNRFESLSLGMFKWASGTSAQVNDPSHPVIIRDNYGNAGTVGTYNDTSAGFGLTMFTQDQSFFGPETSYLQGSAVGPEFRMGSGNFKFANFSGATGYNVAHLVMGGDHIWDSTTLKTYRKRGSAPTGDTDGTVIGTDT